jgi:membrane fusion protein (multidrug efflux system)
MIISILLLLNACGNDNFDISDDITVPVSVIDLKQKPIEEFVDATGTVQASKEVNLTAENSGFYNLLKNPHTGKLYSLGDKVKAGEQIVLLEDPEYINNVRIDLKKLQLEQAKSEFEKQESLYDKGGITLKDLKTAELNYIDQEYTYDNAKLQLEKMKVVAPFAGVIVELPYYTQGVKVYQNSAILKLMNYKNLYLEINLPEKQIGVIKENQSARIMNYTLTEDTLYAKVTQISPAVDVGTRTFKATLAIDNPNWILRPGMFVKTEITVAKKDSAIVIPKDIILSRKKGKIVYVIIKGASQERVITTGLENPTEIEVTKGLKENERLVTKGFETLRKRQKVKIIK